MADAGQPSFGRIEQAPNLTGGLIETLVAQIESGRLSPGQRLPTEQAIVAATGVSRTVVREALASLRARGLIVTRQGLGAFVATPRAGRSFTIDCAGPLSADTLHVLELRMSLEVEASGLAAVRRTPADLDEIRARFAAVCAARAGVQGGDVAGDARGDANAGADEDFAFHRAIMVATANPYFARVFDLFGSHLIPHLRLRLVGLSPAALRHDLRRLRREHAAILAAIEAGNPQAARRAALAHLSRSREHVAQALRQPG